MANKEESKGLDISTMIKSAQEVANKETTQEPALEADSQTLDNLIKPNKKPSQEAKTVPSKEVKETKPVKEKEPVVKKQPSQRANFLDSVEEINRLLLEEVESTNYQDLYMLVNLKRVANIQGLIESSSDTRQYEEKWGHSLNAIYDSLQFIIRTKNGTKPNTTNEKFQKLVGVVESKIIEIHNDLENTINEELDAYLQSLT